MAVNIATQYDTALQAYLDNAGYAEAASITQAKAFLTACTKLIVLIPKSSGTREGHTEMGVDEIRKSLEAARDYLTANDTGPSGRSGPSITYADLRNSQT